MNWTVERMSPVCVKLRIQGERNPDWEQYVLVSADRHLDSPHSDRKLQIFHMEQAVERGAPIIDLADLFDAMQGVHDKRANKSSLMERHKTSGYLNELVRDAADFFRPYASNIAVLSKGNHETGVQKHTEYDLLDGLIFALSQDNPNIFQGGYRGWVKFQFALGETYRASRNAYWIHGYGGGGPVTKDIIQSNRKAVYLPNADYVFSGHTHDQWVFPIERVRLLESGRETMDRQHHIKVPSYKDEFFNQTEGFHIETGKPPKPKGAWWMRFYWSNRSESVQVQFIEAEV